MTLSACAKISSPNPNQRTTTVERGEVTVSVKVAEAVEGAEVAEEEEADEEKENENTKAVVHTKAVVEMAMSKIDTIRRPSMLS